MDAARAFGTGCFKTHRTHDTRGMLESELRVMFLSWYYVMLVTLYFLRRAWRIGRNSIWSTRIIPKLGAFLILPLTLRVLYQNIATPRKRKPLLRQPRRRMGPLGKRQRTMCMRSFELHVPSPILYLLRVHTIPWWSKKVGYDGIRDWKVVKDKVT